MRHILRIIKATSNLWPYYALIGLLTVIVAALNLLMPLLTGQAIDEISKGSMANMTSLIKIALVIFAADLGYNLFSNWSGYLGDRMASRVQQILSSDYYRHIISLPQRYFDNELTGKIINRLNRSIGQIANFMNVLANNFLQFIFSTILALIVVAHFSPLVALMLFALYPIFLILTAISSPKWRSYQHQKNEALDISSGRFAEAINEIRAVKSFNQETRELNFFEGYLSRFNKLTKPQSRYWHKWDIWRRLALNLIFLGIYLFIFYQAASGQLTPGEAVALILYAMQVRIPLFTISFLVGQTQRAMTDSRDYFRAMDEPLGLIDAPGAKQLEVSRGQVEFDKVSFGYQGSRPNQLVSKEISFKLLPGTKTALVGESGGGKTTITNLLLRFYDLNSGLITIDGQNIAEVTQASLRNNIGVVFQEPTLFSGTIKENIAYADPSAKMEQIVAAAKAANADEFISRFDKGYDTEIGERGLKLSGGQKQRLAIARALLKDAPILVLDEATSSLDSRSERKVQQALSRLMRGRTTLIIAHRLSTISRVDQIITLKAGRVDEIGKPAELAKSGGVYARLLKYQRGDPEEVKEKLKAYDLKQ